MVDDDDTMLQSDRSPKAQPKVGSAKEERRPYSGQPTVVDNPGPSSIPLPLASPSTFRLRGSFTCTQVGR